MTLAATLHVPVNRLLDIPDDADALRQELDGLRKQQHMHERANRVRGLIWTLCFLALLISALAGESVLSLLAVGVCLLGSLALLWRNVDTLTDVTSPNADLTPIRIVTVVSALVVAALLGTVLLTNAGLVAFSESAEQALAVALVAGMMIFFGWIGPKLPFNRHTGLRLPWTVADAQTWTLAHRIMGWMGLPTAVLYIATVCAVPDVGPVTLAALAIYIGVPGGISGLYYWRKMTGRIV